MRLKNERFWTIYTKKIDQIEAGIRAAHEGKSIFVDTFDFWHGEKTLVTQVCFWFQVRDLQFVM